MKRPSPAPTLKKGGNKKPQPHQQIGPGGIAFQALLCTAQFPLPLFYFLLYDLESMILVFGGTALYFGGMAAFGHFTWVDLTRRRSR